MIFKQTHRATTVMREAFEKSLRVFAHAPAEQLKRVEETGMKVAGALHANVGVYRRPDVTLNLTTKTYKALERQGLFA